MALVGIVSICPSEGVDDQIGSLASQANKPKPYCHISLLQET